MWVNTRYQSPLTAVTAGEFLNHFLLGFQFYLTDVFLDYKFRSYGWESAVYYTYPYKLRQNKEGGIRWRMNI